MGGKRWTSEEILVVIKAARDGLTREEAAEEVGRSLGSVRGLVSRRVEYVGKIRFRRGHSVQGRMRADILGAITDGHTTGRAIARALGRKEDAVQKALRRLEKDGLVKLTGYGKGRTINLSYNWTRRTAGENDMSDIQTAFPLKTGDEVRLATDHYLSNGKLGRVVSIHDWGCILETNFGSKRYRAVWNEMEPVDLTEFVNPEANGNGHHKAHGVARNGTIVVKGRRSVRPTVTGDPCPNCQGVNLVRTGSCVTCQDCGTNEGCG